MKNHLISPVIGFIFLTSASFAQVSLPSVFGDNMVLQIIMLGEVWICSGQSNMEWSVNHKIKNGEDEAASAGYPDIRIFHVPKTGDNYPQRDCRAGWTECSPATMRTTSALAYFFGRALHITG